MVQIMLQSSTDHWEIEEMCFWKIGSSECFAESVKNVIDISFERTRNQIWSFIVSLTVVSEFRYYTYDKDEHEYDRNQWEEHAEYSS